MKYFLIAGEASGDLHGANLMHSIKSLDAHAEFHYYGGDLMQAQGGGAGEGGMEPRPAITGHGMCPPLTHSVWHNTFTLSEPIRA